MRFEWGKLNLVQRLVSSQLTKPDKKAFKSTIVSTKLTVVQNSARIFIKIKKYPASDRVKFITFSIKFKISVQTVKFALIPS